MKQKPLKYTDIANLPTSHPDYIRFMKEINDLDQAYADAGDLGSIHDDEESLEYFDHFIAGDR